MKKKRKVWKIAAAVVALLLVIRFAAGFFLGGDGEALPMVETAAVKEDDITSTLETSGTIASELIRVYASPVNAQVGEIPVVMGQSVQKGEYLLTYDTASLQKSYDIAELQAKAENAASNDSIAKSNESAGDLVKSAGEIGALQGQIDALNAEIAGLQTQATENEIRSNNNAAANAEVGALEAEIEAAGARVAELEAKKEQGGLSERQKEELKQLQKELRSREEELKKKKKSVKNSAELANELTRIQAQLSQKNSQLSELQGKLAEAQSKNSAAEAGILSQAARANISYTQQASQLTLGQSADGLSRAKAGITADFDGIVTEVAASAGTMAAEGTPLVTLASANDMCVEAPISKYNLANLETGQHAVIEFQDKEYEGSISYISKIAEKGDSGAAMVAIKIHIDAPDDALVIGLDAKVTIQLGAAKGVLTAPISAVNSDMDGEFVYVVKDGVVAKKYVTTGMASTEKIEIKSGVEEGENVIVTVDSSIMEGMAVLEAAQQEEEMAPATEAAE